MFYQVIETWVEYKEKKFFGTQLLAAVPSVFLRILLRVFYEFSTKYSIEVYLSFLPRFLNFLRTVISYKPVTTSSHIWYKCKIHNHTEQWDIFFGSTDTRCARGVDLIHRESGSTTRPLNVKQNNSLKLDFTEEILNQFWFFTDFQLVGIESLPYASCIWKAVFHIVFRTPEEGH